VSRTGGAAGGGAPGGVQGFFAGAAER
jgi:hypothetical protein